MKFRFLMLAMFVASHIALANSFVLPPQGASAFADTEISTNIVLRTLDDGRGRKVLDFSLSIAGTSSNCLQVAFGRDLNENGVLEPSETDTVYGWRSGRYFVEDVRSWNRIVSSEVESGGLFAVHVEADGQYRYRRSSMTCGGSPAFVDLVASRPDWLLRPGWNLARVTRRGEGASTEWVRCELSTRGLVLSIR